MTLEFLAVKDSGADINLIGSIVTQQMNLIQVHENLLWGSNEVVHALQALSEIGLSEVEIQTKYADVFQGLGEFGEPLLLEVELIYQTLETVFHWDIQTPRREFKI